MQCYFCTNPPVFFEQPGTGSCYKSGQAGQGSSYLASATAVLSASLTRRKTCVIKGFVIIWSQEAVWLHSLGKEVQSHYLKQKIHFLLHGKNHTNII